jgi:hypothetical protein
VPHLRAAWSASSVPVAGSLTLSSMEGIMNSVAWGGRGRGIERDTGTGIEREGQGEKDG